MNLRLALLDDDGNAIEIWSVDQDFGDLRDRLSKTNMAAIIAAAVAEARK